MRALVTIQAPIRNIEIRMPKSRAIFLICIPKIVELELYIIAFKRNKYFILIIILRLSQTILYS